MGGGLCIRVCFSFLFSTQNQVKQIIIGLLWVIYHIEFFFGEFFFLVSRNNGLKILIYCLILSEESQRSEQTYLCLVLAVYNSLIILSFKFTQLNLVFEDL